VAAGRFLTVIVPLEIISLAAALSFILFGLWTLGGGHREAEEKKETRFGPVLTVGIAFFLAEMGDKTQLATVSLAVEYRDMLSVLTGTTLGLLAANAAGIAVAVVLRKHIPERTIRWSSAVVFMLFGLLGLHQVLSGLFSPATAWGGVLTAAFLSAGTGYLLSRRQGSKNIAGDPLER
jgi:putative Ca2+/H+ antiporter (TMEM165/GDT1 family)